MKLQLQLRVIGWSGSLQPDASTEVHLNLERDFDLPFAPYEDLRILLPAPDDELDADAYEQYEKLSENATEYVSFLTLDTVFYDVGQQRFSAVSYLGYNRWDADDERLRTLEEVKTMGRILVVGYGFRPQFDDDEEILK